MSKYFDALPAAIAKCAGAAQKGDAETFNREANFLAGCADKADKYDAILKAIANMPKDPEVGIPLFLTELKYIIGS